MLNKSTLCVLAFALMAAVPLRASSSGSTASRSGAGLCSDLTDSAASCSTDATNATNITTGTLNADRLPTLTDTLIPNNITIDLATQCTTALAGDSATDFFSSGTVNTARLGSGTANSTTYLRGDQTWASLSVSPGGSDGQIQLNVSGAFAGDSGFTFNPTTDALTLAGAFNGLVVGSVDGAKLGISYSGGSAYWALSNDGTTAYSRANAVEFSNVGNSRYMRFENGALKVGAGTVVSWFNHNDPLQGSADTTLERQAAGVVKLSDALRLNPRSAPPVTCGSANTASVIYYDSDSNEICACNGTSWTGLIAGGACS